MRFGLGSLLGVAAVSAALGALAGGFGAQMAQPPPPPSFHDLIHHTMGLTAEEEARIAPIEQAFERQLRQGEGRITATNAALAQAISAGNPDAIALAQAESNAALVALQDLNTAHLVAMREALDDSHRPAFDAALAASLSPETR
jgi:Heavy-metal resistance